MYAKGLALATVRVGSLPHVTLCSRLRRMGDLQWRFGHASVPPSADRVDFLSGQFVAGGLVD